MNKEVKEILEDLRNKNMSVDDLTHNDKTKLLDYITSLEEKIEIEHKAYMGTVNELTETATRIDKAVEYINTHKIKLSHSWDEPNCDYWIATNPDDLLNILKGSDK